MFDVNERTRQRCWRQAGGRVRTCLVAATAVCGVLAVGTRSSAGEWEGYRNRLLPEHPPRTEQAFGFGRSNHAGGAAAGEIGGRIQRSLSPARYVRQLGRTLSFDERLEASGRLAVTRADGGSGALVGWRHHSSRGWRTPNSLAFRVDGNGEKFWVFYEYGTEHGRTGGGGAFEGERYQTTRTPPFAADGTVHRWRLSYDPDARGGAGEITFSIDDRTYRLPVREVDRNDGMRVDQFGIWNQEATGNSLEMWLDDVTVNGEAMTFDEDPEWVGAGNHASFDERLVRPYHDFGQAEDGRLGGVIWRDESPCYYGKAIAPLTLDEEFSARGTITFDAAGPDSGVYLGWFNAESKRNQSRPEHEVRGSDYLGLLLEGPSRVGHYLRPAFATAEGGGATAESGPVLRPTGERHTWSIHYRPEAATRGGILECVVDDATQRMEISAADRAAGARMNRFGMWNIQSGGWHVEVYVDDLEIRTGPDR